MLCYSFLFFGFVAFSYPLLFVVAVRMRPLNQNEGNLNRIWKVLPKYSSVTQTTRTGQPLPERVSGRNFFTFDKTFGETTSTSEVYDSVAKGIVSSVVSGLNGTIFAYGQTSSGKTYTMQGAGSIKDGSTSSTTTSSGAGIVHMAASDIFQNIQQASDRIFLVRASFLEIYNEEVRDLLGNNTNQTLQIREDPRRGVFVQAKEEIVTDFQTLLNILFQGENNRCFASTAMNERSSRSHTIFRITIESRKKNENTDDDEKENQFEQDDGAVLISTLNLVDLAGSESVRHTGATGERQKEGGMINQRYVLTFFKYSYKSLPYVLIDLVLISYCSQIYIILLCTYCSLLTLSRVIVALGTPNQTHINFRDSKLTRILQPSLSGNARMAVICCATPSELYLEETRSTLLFASRAKLVKTRAQVNEVLDDRSLIRRLQRELAEARRQNGPASEQQSEQLKVLQKRAATAGTAAKVAEDKLQRLKMSILNSGVLFGGSNQSTQSNALDIGMSLGDTLIEDESTRRKRRKSDGTFIIDGNAPKHNKPRFHSPQLDQKTKKLQVTKHLSPKVELNLLRSALSAKNNVMSTLSQKLEQSAQLLEANKSDMIAAKASNQDLQSAKSIAEEEAVRLKTHLEAMQSELQSVIASHQVDSEAKEETITKTLAKLEKSLSITQSLEEDLEQSKLENENLKKQLEPLVEESSRFPEERSNMQSIIDSLRDQVAQLQQEATESNAERDTLQQNLQELQTSYDVKVEELNGQKSKCDELSLVVTQQKAELKNSAAKSTQLQESVSTLETKLEDKTLENDKMTKELDSAQAVIAQFKALFDEKNSDLLTLSNYLETIMKQNDGVSESIYSTNKICDGEMYASLEEILADIKAQNESTEGAIRNVTSEAASLENKINELESTAETSKTNLLGLASKISDFMNEKQVLESQLKRDHEETLSSKYAVEQSLEEARNHISDLQKTLKTNQDESEQSIFALSSTVEAMTQENEELATKLTAATNKILTNERVVEELSIQIVQSQAEYSSYAEELQELQSKWEGTLDDLDKARVDITSLESSLTTTKEEKLALESELEMTVTELESMSKKASTLEEASKTNNEKYSFELEDIKSQYDQLQQKFQSSKQSHEDTTTEKLELETMLKEASAEVDLLTEKLSRVQNDRDNMVSDLKTIESEFKAVSQSRNETAETIDVMKQKQEQLLQELLSVQSEKAALQTEHEGAITQIKAMVAQVNTLDAVIVKSVEKMEASIRQIESLQLEKQEMELKISQKGQDYDSILSQKNDLESILNKTMEEKAALETELEMAVTELESMRSELSTLETIRQEHNLAASMVKSLESSLLQIKEEKISVETELESMSKDMSVLAAEKEEVLTTLLDRDQELQIVRSSITKDQEHSTGDTTALKTENESLKRALEQERSDRVESEKRLRVTMGDEQRELIKSAESAMERLREDLSQTQKSLTQSENEAYAARETIETYREKLQRSDAEVARLQNEINILNDKMKDLSSKCDAESSDKIAVLTSEVKAAEEECDAAKQKATEIGEKLNRSIKSEDKAIREACTLRDKIDMLEKSRSQLQENFESLEKELRTTIEKTNEELEKKKKEAAKYKKACLSKDDIAKLTAQKKTYLKSKNDLKTARAKIESLKRENEILSAANAGANPELSNLSFDKSALEEKLRKVGKRCQMLEEDNETIADALRSCHENGVIDREDIPGEVISLCDKLSSLQEKCNALTKESVISSESELEVQSLKQQIRKLKQEKDAYENYSNSEIQKLEQENLDLSQDYMALKTKYQTTKTRLNKLTFCGDDEIGSETVDRSIVASSQKEKSRRSVLQSPTHSTKRPVLGEDINKNNIPASPSSTVLSEKKRSSFFASNNTPMKSAKKLRRMLPGSSKKASTKKVKKAPGLGEAHEGNEEAAQPECNQS